MPLLRRDVIDSSANRRGRVFAVRYTTAQATNALLRLIEPSAPRVGICVFVCRQPFRRIIIGLSSTTSGIDLRQTAKRAL